MKINPFPILLACFLPLLSLGQGHPTGLSSPILTNFWIRDFNIDVTRPNTQLLKLNLNSQQFDTGGTTITITNFGNASGGTNVFNTIYVSNVFTTNITVFNNTVTSNLFVTNLFVTNLTVFDTTITSNLFVTNITANTIITTNLFVTNIDASTIITTNLFVTNIFNTFLVTSNVIAGNIQGTPPHIAMFRPDNFSVADSIVTQNSDTNGVTVNGTGDGSVTLGGANNPFVEFGDGGTNIFRKVGRALVYTNNDNGSHLVSIDVQNNNGGIGQFGVNGNSASISPSGTANLVDVGDNAGGHFIWTANTAYPFSLGDLGKFGGSYPPSPWRDINSTRTNYIWGYYDSISTNFSYAAISHNGTNGLIMLSSKASGIAGAPRPFGIDRNLGAIITTGDTTFVDMFAPTQTNQLSGALTFAHATNGTDRVEWTHRRYLFNPSGADRLITLPGAWHNISGATFTVTNSTMARLDVTSWGDTSSSALQTNVSSMVTFMP